MKLNKIYHCDCLDFMKNMCDDSIDLILTDPPYELSKAGGTVNYMSADKYHSKDFANITDGFDVVTTLNEFERICKKVNIFIFCSNKQISKIMSWGEDKNYYTTLLVWSKTNPIPFANKTWRQDAEYCIHIREHGAVFKGNAQIKRKVTTLPINPSQFGHPTEKPIKLIKKYLLIGSNENDTVFDPFIGSGTTAVACKELNRNFIGCEIEDKYIEIANKRIKSATKDLL